VVGCPATDFLFLRCPLFYYFLFFCMTLDLIP
jgi:hypothetical protein